MSIVFYDDYHVIPHPPIKFQVDTLYFGWIFKVVIFQLPLVFHTRFYFLKTNGFT